MGWRFFNALAKKILFLEENFCEKDTRVPSCFFFWFNLLLCFDIGMHSVPFQWSQSLWWKCHLEVLCLKWVQSHSIFCEFDVFYNLNGWNCLITMFLCMSWNNKRQEHVKHSLISISSDTNLVYSLYPFLKS